MMTLHEIERGIAHAEIELGKALRAAVTHRDNPQLQVEYTERALQWRTEKARLQIQKDMLRGKPGRFLNFGGR